MAPCATWFAAACPAGALQINLSKSTPVTLKPGAMAYALPYEGSHIVVFLDRVQAVAVVRQRVLLAHVFVHEITHILEGVSRHSETGVMMAHWNSSDYRTMTLAPLPFAAVDVELIKRGLENREKTLANSKTAQDRNTEAAVYAK